jgi:hypothetical protein
MGNLRKPRILSTIVAQAFPQTAPGERGSPFSEQPQAKLGISRAKPQRRKGRRKNVKIIHKNIYLSPSNLAPLRLGVRNIRIREPSTSKKFKWHAMTNMLVFVFGWQYEDTKKESQARQARKIKKELCHERKNAGS